MEDKNNFIKWSDLYSVKNKCIDSQHQKLIEILNTIFAMISKGDNSKLGAVLDELFAYADYHFKTEEEFFDKYNYPQCALHKKQHADFVQQVIDFKEKYDAGKIQLKFEVFYFLQEWLINHIVGSDKGYMNYFYKENIDEYTET